MSSADAVSGSLARRLLGRTLAALLIVWGLNAALIIAAARVEITEDLDDSLERAGALLLGFVEHEYQESGGTDIDTFPEPEELPRGVVLYQVWSARGRLLMRSQDAPLQPLSSAGEGYHDLQFHGEDWRLYTVWNAARSLRLDIAEPQWHRREIAGDLSLALLMPLLLGTPVLALLIWLALRRGLAPVQEAATDVAGRAADDFSPLADQRLPRELHPLVNAFNGLLLRLSQALESERRFTEDVAHELRTPLAAIRLQAQIAGRTGDPLVAQASLQRLISGVDRADRVIDQLLTLARLDPDRAADLRTEDFPLQRVVAETLGEFEGLAAQRNLRIASVIRGETMHGSPQAVYVVLRNLLDNALRHSPDASTVRVQASAEDGEFRLSVQDQGPGIPPADRERVLDRFVRLRPGSSGLGLFIARRIAELFGGRIEIADADDGRGARVTVRWHIAHNPR